MSIESSWNWVFGSSVNSVPAPNLLSFAEGNDPLPLPSSPAFPDPAGSLDYIQTAEGVASVSDAEGNLLCYTNGVTVWGVKTISGVLSSYIIETGLLGSDKSMQSSTIVPDPYNENRYYIFTVGNWLFEGGTGCINASWNNSSNKITYTIINFTGPLGNQTGTVEGTKNQILYNGQAGVTDCCHTDAGFAECLTTIPHANGIDFWVVTREAGSIGPTQDNPEGGSRWFAFLVNNTGVNTGPVISNASGSDIFDGDNRLGQIKANKQFNQICFAVGDLPQRSNLFYKACTAPKIAVALYSFNNASGKIGEGVDGKRTLLQTEVPYFVTDVVTNNILPINRITTSPGTGDTTGGKTSILGCEFSPDGLYLYLSFGAYNVPNVNNTVTSAILQITLSEIGLTPWTQGQLSDSIIRGYFFTDTSGNLAIKYVGLLGVLQLGPDGKIYCPLYNTNILLQIPDPNSLLTNTSLSFDVNPIRLMGYGLPNIAYSTLIEPKNILLTPCCPGVEPIVVPPDNFEAINIGQTAAITGLSDINICWEVTETEATVTGGIVTPDQFYNDRESCLIIGNNACTDFYYQLNDCCTNEPYRESGWIIKFHYTGLNSGPIPSDFSNNIITEISGAFPTIEGCFVLTVTDSTGPLLFTRPWETAFQLVDVTSNCANCRCCVPKYVLTDCSNEANTLVTDADLSGYIGQIIKIESCPDICWTFVQVDCGFFPEETVVVTALFNTCEECLPAAPAPVVESPLKYRFVKPGYTTLGCSPEYTEKVNCAFAAAYHKKMLADRYGIEGCTEQEFINWDIKKSLLDLKAISSVCPTPET